MRKQKQKSPRRRITNYMVKKSCRFCRDKIRKIEYSNTDVLSRYITEQGKILPRRISGNCSYHQRQLTKAIKRARAISLLPYVAE